VQIHAVNSEDGKPHQTMEAHAFSSCGKLCLIPMTKNQITQSLPTPVVYTTPHSHKQPKILFLIHYHAPFSMYSTFWP